MARIKLTAAERKEEQKKNSRSADRKKQRNKVNAEAKKLGEKAVMEIAANMPAGQGNAFMQTFTKYVEAVRTCRAANKNRSNVRSELKGMKVDMAAFDRVFKLFEMDPVDVAARKATEALYEQHIGLKLSEEQKEIVAGVEAKRENARKAMHELNGGEAGREVGSGTDEGLIGHNSNGEPEAEGEQEEEGEGMPAHNESVESELREGAAA